MNKTIYLRVRQSHIERIAALKKHYGSFTDSEVIRLQIMTCPLPNKKQLKQDADMMKYIDPNDPAGKREVILQEPHLDRLQRLMKRADTENLSAMIRCAIMSPIPK